MAARKQLEISVQNEKLSTREYNPALEVSASAGAKNGYQPYLLICLKIELHRGLQLSGFPSMTGAIVEVKRSLGNPVSAQADAAILLDGKTGGE